MSGKLLILLGLLISTVLVYFCIDTKKDALYAELNPPPTVVETVPTTEKVVEPVNTIEATKAPSFAYALGTKETIAAYLSTEDKKAQITQNITKICENENCIQKIKYFHDIKPFSFAHETFDLIAYAKEEKIKGFALTVSKKSIKLEGHLTKQEQIERMQPLLDTFVNQGYSLDNQMNIDNLKVSQQEEILKEEITASKPELVTPEHSSVEDASTSINEIVSKNNITFDYRSSNISQESKDTLDKVLDILLGLDNVSIEVAGYTDAKGDETYNKVLSQKRADTVRNYLIKSGIRSQLITSVGYGEENPISDPKDIINRRVEIHLSEGK